MEETNNPRAMMSNNELPESPRLPMEFLSRSWSLSALHLSKALSHSFPSMLPKTVAPCATPPILEEEEDPSVALSGESEDHSKKKLSSGKSFSFASSATSQLILERIMSQSEASPMTSGRPSCSEPPTGIGAQSFSASSLTADMFDSPTSSDISISLDSDKLLHSSNIPLPLLPPIRVGPRSGGATPVGSAGSAVGSKTVGRWLKERREKKKEEARVYNAQLHAAVSVAAVAASVAAAVSATAAAPARKTGGDDKGGQTNTALATAATLVAARCVEAAEAMGADRDHLTSVISSAVNVQTHGDIMTLTAAAATALRGAATLKARIMKEMCNIAAVSPAERLSGFGAGLFKGESDRSFTGSSSSEASLQGDNFLGLCNEEILARGSELLKRTRNGDLHWKLVSVYINGAGQVILKMKSRHVAGTITKKKKKVLVEVQKDMQAWPERRRCVDIGGEKRRYFGLKTAAGRVIEFECRNQQEYDVWTQGVSKLLSIVNNGREKNRMLVRNDASWS